MALRSRARKCRPGSVMARFPPSSSIAYGLGTMVERGCWIGRRRTIALIWRAHRRQSKRSICRRLNVSCIGLRCPPSRGMFSPTLTLHVRTPRVPLPMPATDCLAKLGEQRFTTSEEMLTAVMSAARGPAAISRTKRAVHLSLCAIPTMLMLVIGLLSVYNVRPRVVSTHPHVRSVSAGEAADRAGVEADDVVVAVDGEPITFASQLRDAIARHPDQPITLSILRDGQPLMIRATPARRANQGQLGIVVANETPEMSLKVTWRYLWLHAIVGLMVAGTLGLLSALAARGGIALRLMSIAVVTRNGTLASGSRTRLRAVLSWLPVLAASAAAFAGHSPLLTLTPQAAQFLRQSVSPWVCPIFFPNEPSILFVRVAIITVALAVFALAVIFALIRPERGLQDRLAGTWLVPR